MSSLADLPELVGFFSYSREDDADSDGALSALRERIQRELRSQLGRSMKTFRLWQDKEAIAAGKLWKAEIETAVAQSVFFIPIITPTVVRSPYCKFELELFLAREATLDRSDLVFPIYYIEVEALEDSVRQQNDPVLSLIAKRQYRDWLEFRHRDINEADVKKEVIDFCKDIRKALNRHWLSPEERKKQEEAEARRRAEEERQQQEAEAKRREAEARRREEEARRKAAAEAQRLEREREAEELRKKEEDERRQAEEERRRLKPRPAWPPSRRALVSVVVLFVVVVGSVGLWFADTRRTTVSLETPPVQSPPAPVSPDPPVPTQAAPAQPPATPIQPAPSGVVPLSPDREGALKPKDTFKECAGCPEMVVVPAGSFTMGSPASEAGRYDDEGPQHTVTIGRPFAVGKFHVTVDQFAAFVTETGYDAGSKCWTFEDGKAEERSGRSWRNPGSTQGGSHPAVCLNWNDAKAYVDWLARKTGKTYRLLTEAEWEYAARARTEPGAYPRYSFGNDEKDLCRYGNGADQTAKTSIAGAKDWPVAPCNDGYAYTSPVGSFAANGFALYDMQGNAWQWTEDCSHDSYTGAPSDGRAWTTGDCSSRVLRGGSWFNVPHNLRSADRSRDHPDIRNNDVGFRVARTL